MPIAQEHHDKRRRSFGGIADLYDRRRPSYPQALVDDVIALGLTAAGSTDPRQLRAIEVGAGTGKASVLFAAAGVQIEAVEPSAGMAALARSNLEAFPNVTVTEAEFETMPAPAEPYPLLYSAQAWHWINPATRYDHARAALIPGGVFAAFWNRTVWDEQPLKTQLDAVYARLAPDLPSEGPMRPGADSRPGLEGAWDREIAEVETFTDAELRVYDWETVYTATEYTELLRTHSDHNVLPPDRREPLLDAIAEVIDGAGGELRLPYVTRLCLARAV